MPPSVVVPTASRSTSGASSVLNAEIVLVLAKIASVIFSGAGPPFDALYLMPKSPSGPPGLWLADRMMPPKAFLWRMRFEAAGVDRMPPCPTITRPKPLAAAISHRGLNGLAVEVSAVAADHQVLAFEAVEAVEDRLDEVLDVMRLLEMRDLLAQPRGAGLLVVEGRGGYSLHAGNPARDGGYRRSGEDRGSRSNACVRRVTGEADRSWAGSRGRCLGPCDGTVGRRVPRCRRSPDLRGS